MLLSKLANREIMNFLETVTIKNSYFADQMFDLKVKDLVKDYLPEIYNPYYRHLNGEYILSEPLVSTGIVNPTTGLLETQVYNDSVTLDSGKVLSNADVYESDYFDDMIYITSLDTQKEIPFTKENLHTEFAKLAGRSENSVHKKTLVAYQLPSRYYQLLCDKYPDKTDLIKAIVYPIPSKTAAISADNYTVLSYDDTILDKNERVSIISRLKSTMDVIRCRWDVNEYKFEEHYPMVVWAMIWNVLIMQLRAQRFSNIKTPHVHPLHIWNYLSSKNLGGYRGYLTSDQEMFLYRNLRYILANRGKQSTTNVLIDELLNNVGIKVKAKTIVLDTTNVLDGEEDRVSIVHQCDNCSRRSICNKGITNVTCNEFIGLDNSCKPTPIVLTEEFVGSSKSKIINTLISQYNCTEAEANLRYSRSFLWKDADIEEIKNTLDRDQIVDLNGTTESLDTLVQREFSAGLEPVYNPTIVEEQFNSLRHIDSTYLPTKLLEVSRITYNQRYYELFEKFLLHTMLRFASSGLVNNTYRFKVSDETSEIVLSFKEMLAILYLGILREYNNVLVDDSVTPPAINWNLNYSKACAACTQECKTAVKDSEGKLIYSLAIPSKAYVSRAFKYCIPVKQEELYAGYKDAPTDLSEYMFYEEQTGLVTDESIPFGVLYYEIDTSANSYVYALKYINDVLTPVKILNRAMVITADEYFVSGKTYYKLSEESLLSYFNITDKKIVQLSNGNIYIVHDEDKYFYELTTDETFQDNKAYYTLSNGSYTLAETTAGNVITSNTYYEKCTYPIWRQYDKKLVIDGMIKTTNDSVGNKILSYYEEGSEIPIIPTYFEWHYYHLIADSNSTNVISKNIRPAQTYNTTDGQVSYRDLYMDYDTDKAYTTLVLRVDNYVNVDWVINNYVDISAGLTDQAIFGQYLSSMFTMFIKLQSYANGAGATTTHLALKSILDAILYKDRVEFDLTGTTKSNIMGDSSVVAYYEDWLTNNKDLYTTLQGFDESTDPNAMWNTFNNVVVEQLLAECDLSYAESTADTSKYDKLKELVMRLSSYNITLIDDNGQTTTSAILAPLVQDDAKQTITQTDIYYIELPIPQDVSPYAAKESMTGARVSGSVTIPAVNVQTSTPYQISYLDGKWYYRYGTLVSYEVMVPASLADYTSANVISETYNVIEYTKTITKTKVEWSQWVRDTNLDALAGDSMRTAVMNTEDTILVDVYTYDDDYLVCIKDDTDTSSLGNNTVVDPSEIEIGDSDVPTNYELESK